MSSLRILSSGVRVTLARPYSSTISPVQKNSYSYIVYVFHKSTCTNKQTVQFHHFTFKNIQSLKLSLDQKMPEKKDKCQTRTVQPFPVQKPYCFTISPAEKRHSSTISPAPDNVQLPCTNKQMYSSTISPVQIRTAQFNHLFSYQRCFSNVHESVT